jgi:cell division septal protein FtsQ
VLTVTAARILTLVLLLTPPVYCLHINPPIRADIYSFSKIKQINVSGASLVSNSDIEEKLHFLKKESILTIDLKKVLSTISNLQVPDKVTIYFTHKRILNIYIVEHKPFAIWCTKGQYYLVNEEGLKILQLKHLKKFQNLLVIFGEEIESNIKDISTLIPINSFLTKVIYWLNFQRKIYHLQSK